jgi:hypothetical protein
MTVSFAAPKNSPNRENRALARLASDQVDRLIEATSPSPRHEKANHTQITQRAIDAVRNDVLDVARRSPGDAIDLISMMARDLWQRAHGKTPLEPDRAKHELWKILGADFAIPLARAGLTALHQRATAAELRQRQSESEQKESLATPSFSRTPALTRLDDQRALSEAGNYLRRHLPWAKGMLPTEGCLRVLLDQAQKNPAPTNDALGQRLHQELRMLPQYPTTEQLKDTLRPYLAAETLSTEWVNRASERRKISELYIKLSGSTNISLAQRVKNTFGPTLELEIIRREAILDQLDPARRGEHSPAKPMPFTSPLSVSAIDTPSCSHGRVILTNRAAYALTNDAVLIAERSEGSLPNDLAWRQAVSHKGLKHYSTLGDCLLVQEPEKNATVERCTVIGPTGESRSFVKRQGESWHSAHGPNNSRIVATSDGEKVTPQLHIDAEGTITDAPAWSYSAEIDGERRFVGFKRPFLGLGPNFAVSGKDAKVETRIGADQCYTQNGALFVRDGESFLKASIAPDGRTHFTEVARYTTRQNIATVTFSGTEVTVTLPGEIKEMTPLLSNETCRAFTAVDASGCRFIVTCFTTEEGTTAQAHPLAHHEETPSHALPTASGVLFDQLAWAVKNDGTTMHFPGVWSAEGKDLFLCRLWETPVAVCRPGEDPFLLPTAQFEHSPATGAGIKTGISGDGKTVYVASGVLDRQGHSNTLLHVIEGRTVRQCTIAKFACSEITSAGDSIVIEGARSGVGHNHTFYDKDLTPVLTSTGRHSPTCVTDQGIYAVETTEGWVAITGSQSPKQKDNTLLEQILERVKEPQLLNNNSPELSAWLAGRSTAATIPKLHGAAELARASGFDLSSPTTTAPSPGLVQQFLQIAQNPPGTSSEQDPPESRLSSALRKALDVAALPLAPFAAALERVSHYARAQQHAYAAPNPLPHGSPNPLFNLPLALVPKMFVAGTGVQPTLLVEDIGVLDNTGSWTSGNLPSTKGSTTTTKEITLHALHGRGGWYEASVPAGGSLVDSNDLTVFQGSSHKPQTFTNLQGRLSFKAPPVSVSSYRVKWPVGPHTLSLPADAEGLAETRRIAGEAVGVKLTQLPRDTFPRPIKEFISTIEHLTPLEQVHAVVAYADNHVAYRWLDTDKLATKRPHMAPGEYLHSMQRGGPDSDQFHGVCAERGTFIVSLLQSLGHPVCLGRGMQGGPGVVAQFARHAAACYLSVTETGAVSLVPLEPSISHFGSSVAPQQVRTYPTARIESEKREPENREPEIESRTEQMVAQTSPAEPPRKQPELFTSHDARVLEHLYSHLLFARLDGFDEHSGAARLEAIIRGSNDVQLDYRLSQHLRSEVETEPTKPLDRYTTLPPDKADGYTLLSWMSREHSTFAELAPQDRSRVLGLLASAAGDALSHDAQAAIAALRNE